MCNINYHMVWSVKYRRKILKPEIEEYLQELVQQIAEVHGGRMTLESLTGAGSAFTLHLPDPGK